jgi:predicted nuclease of restriction endonuclease-like RecB superfamily
MLTADLLRVTTRNGELKPRYVDAEDDKLLGRAARLCALYQANIGISRGEMKERVADIVGDDASFAVTRGLKKLLDDRSAWEPVSQVDPVDLRRAVFETAAAMAPVSVRPNKRHASRDQVLRVAAGKLGMSAEDLDAAMYADLKAEHRLTAHKALEPLALMHRYNLALAQGMLYRATALRVRIATRRPKQVRALFRELKFLQLMHRAVREGKEWVVTIDGPLSLFSQSQRYGLQLARLIPSILLLDGWSFEADVAWNNDGKLFRFALSPDAGLVSHLKPRGTWRSEEEKTLVKRIAKKGWEVDRRPRIIDLDGRGVLVPDMVLKRDGRELLVEIVGYWRKSYIERRATLIAEAGPKNLVLCVSKGLNTESGPLTGLQVSVLPFANVINVAKLTALAEELAT